MRIHFQRRSEPVCGGAVGKAFALTAEMELVDCQRCLAWLHDNRKPLPNVVRDRAMEAAGRRETGREKTRAWFSLRRRRERPPPGDDR